VLHLAIAVKTFNLYCTFVERRKVKEKMPGCYRILFAQVLRRNQNFHAAAAQ